MIWFGKKQKDHKKDYEVHEQSSCCHDDENCGRERRGWNPFGCQRPCPPRPCCCTGTTGPTAPSIYAQHGNCRNHAAFHYLKDN